MRRLLRALRSRWTDLRTGTLACYGGPLDGERRKAAPRYMCRWAVDGKEYGTYDFVPGDFPGCDVYRRDDRRRGFFLVTWSNPENLAEKTTL